MWSGSPFLVAERVVIECVSEKLKFVRSTYVRLFSIDLEAQLPFNEGCDRVHDPLGTGLASDSNDHVVCISAEMQSPCLKFLVQLVEHYVRKQRTKTSPLWSADLRLFKHPFDHYTSLEELPYQRFGVSVVYYPSNITHEPVLRDIVEELLQIKVHYPFIAFVYVPGDFGHRHKGAPSWSEAIAVLTEQRLKHR